MLLLVGAEALDVAAQLRFVVTQGRGLPGVVLVNRLLDRHGAGHGRTVAHCGGHRAKRQARDVP